MATLIGIDGTNERVCKGTSDGSCGVIAADVECPKVGKQEEELEREAEIPSPEEGSHPEETPATSLKEDCTDQQLDEERTQSLGKVSIDHDKEKEMNAVFQEKGQVSEDTIHEEEVGTDEEVCEKGVLCANVQNLCNGEDQRSNSTKNSLTLLEESGNQEMDENHDGVQADGGDCHPPAAEEPMVSSGSRVQVSTHQGDSGTDRGDNKPNETLSALDRGSEVTQDTEEDSLPVDMIVLVVDDDNDSDLDWGGSISRSSMATRAASHHRKFLVAWIQVGMCCVGSFGFVLALVFIRSRQSNAYGN